MVLRVDVTLHISVQRCPADPHTILLFPPAIICLAQASPHRHRTNPQGQVRVLPFFIQHQIRAWPTLEARKSDMSWVQSCPQEAPKLEGRWPHNRELPVCDVMKCQELGAKNQGRFSG